MTRSTTRFTVEGQKQFDSAGEALAEARLMLYVSPKDETRALATLQRGEPVTLVYGFVSVTIAPPLGRPVSTCEGAEFLSDPCIVMGCIYHYGHDGAHEVDPEELERLRHV